MYIPAVSALPDVEKRCPIDLSCTRSKGIDLQGFRYVADAIEPVGFCRVQVYPMSNRWWTGRRGIQAGSEEIAAESPPRRIVFASGFAPVFCAALICSSGVWGFTQISMAED